MSENIRWGILGTGSIANKFATGLQAVADADLIAIGSRAQGTADAFADKYGAPKRHASYEALAGDSEVDAIYISTPHTFHKDNSILCLEAGKAVLCEKPFAINATEAEMVIQCARNHDRFLMEAMWTRFLPVLIQVRQWLADGEIGDVRMVTADFGFRAGVNPDGRLFNPALGGGGLMDVGIYPISLASMVFGVQPSRIKALAEIGETAVDEQAAMIFSYDTGALASLWTGIRTSTPQEATILGTDGQIRIESPFWDAKTATLSVDGNDPVHIEPPRSGNGYNYEAIEVGRCLRAGKKESDTMPLDETLAVIKTLDTVREQVGLKYPMDV